MVSTIETETETETNDKQITKQYQYSRHPRLNERILSSMTRRSVAAHPWHDLEIGIFPFSFLWICSHFIFISFFSNTKLLLFMLCRSWCSCLFQLCKDPITFIWLFIYFFNFCAWWMLYVLSIFFPSKGEQCIIRIYLSSTFSFLIMLVIEVFLFLFSSRVCPPTYEAVI